jgi:predicted RNase H-like nuclease (RuvC/YqgF family)
VEALEEERDQARAVAAARQKDLDVRTAEYDERTQQLRDQAVELADRIRDLAAKTEELQKCTQQLVHTQADLAAEQDQNINLSRAADAIRAELVDRDSRIEHLQGAVADAVRQVNELHGSLSWRWTRPARAVYRLLTSR